MAAAEDRVLSWLLRGDPSIRSQALRDLVDESDDAVEREGARISRAGWGRKILTLQAGDGSWGGGLYSPKWTSTTYTLLLLWALGLQRGNRKARNGTALLLDSGLYRDGGINFWVRWSRSSETCVTGMVLGIASRFAPDDARCDQLAQHLLEQQMDDGGWNCQRPRGATHSSLHTTILALEGLLEYEHSGGKHSNQTGAARDRAHEFLFRHRMYRSHRTGEIINKRMELLSFPPQWHYDILRGLDYLQAAQAPRDARLEESIGIVRTKRLPDGSWPLQNRYRGQYHFDMEQPGAPSRWNTLRALRVLRWWNG